MAAAEDVRLRSSRHPPQPDADPAPGLPLQPGRDLQTSPGQRAVPRVPRRHRRLLPPACRLRDGRGDTNERRKSVWIDDDDCRERHLAGVWRRMSEATYSSGSRVSGFRRCTRLGIRRDHRWENPWCDFANVFLLFWQNLLSFQQFSIISSEFLIKGVAGILKHDGFDERLVRLITTLRAQISAHVAQRMVYFHCPPILCQFWTPLVYWTENFKTIDETTLVNIGAAVRDNLWTCESSEIFSFIMVQHFSPAVEMGLEIFSGKGLLNRPFSSKDEHFYY